ncbi:putative kinesin, partial [Lasiodiplodia theobromae]|uniref:putative kinesin n=1 Tax=Lasiodiplodia theobromae TaxID=45133 RepID=UPI0015C308CF
MAESSGPSSDGPVNLLALDGGGIRGLSELLILHEAMRRIQYDLGLEELPRPCDYFHLIGGTSTGGLIALLLGRFRMSTEEALRIYNEIAGSIFCKGNKKPSFKDGTFKATTLKNAVRELVTRTNVGSSMLHPSESGEMGKAFVCAMPARNMEHPRLFRTYRVRENASVNCEIWEAARATTAAPTFFKRVTIGELGQVKEEFIDGGVRCNNPADEVLEEARRVFGDDRMLNCLVSIGTGHPGVIGLSKPDVFQRLLPTELINALKQIATDCEKKSKELSSRFQNIESLYFRFNVSHGLGEVSLEEWKKMPEVQTHTSAYLANSGVSSSMNELISLLKNPRKEGGYALRSTRGILPKSRPRSTPRVPIRSRPETSPIFTGREQILARLEAFFNAQSGQRLQRKELLLYGMGGAGKTQISLKFAERNIQRFKHIFWIDGSSAATVEQCFKDIAAENCPDVSSAEASAQSAFLWLGRLTEEWLLLFDNVEDFKLASEALPRHNGNVIYTSRNPEGYFSLPEGAHHEVGEMDEVEALQLLSSARRLRKPVHREEEEHTKKLVVELGYLPLAIDQAGAYMATRSCSAQDYLRRFDRKRVELMQKQSYQRASSHDQAVYATWDVSYATLEQVRDNETDVEQRKVAQAAIHIQGVFAMLHRENIMKEIFRRAAELGKFQEDLGETVEQGQAQHLAEFATILLPLDEEGIWDPKLFECGLRELLKLSLVRRDDLGTAFYIHPLVHFWAQDR